MKHPYYATVLHTTNRVIQQQERMGGRGVRVRENVQTVNKSVIKFITVCLSLARKHSHFGQCGIYIVHSKCVLNIRKTYAHSRAAVHTFTLTG